MIGKGALMAVYVDQFEQRWKTCLWAFCAHMMADTEVELDEMARAIGLKPEWKQVSSLGHIHYDLSDSKRAAAIRCGAVAITTREMIMKRLIASRGDKS